MKPSPTAVSLLLTNLQLLGYDNDPEESFPITPDIFTSLKNKGKAFEHIVYHLLHTLDPEECAIRLEACWPIYEPAQSREFRNIVFKWLADLKKSGQMGGNILVRRTLLDDCSGDRYEELLLSLSTTVLRDQIEKGNFQDTNRKTFAYKQASSFAPSPKVLAVLILAYQSSLTRLLLSRRLSKSQWSSFSSFLEAKESQISVLSESQLQSAPDETPQILPRGYEEEIFRKWRNNWLGDQRWLEILLKGDSEYMRDQFFELPFEKALAKHHHFKNGLVGLRNGDVSLRALEKQVQEQKSRLRELREMREAALKTVPNLDVNSSPRAEAKEKTRTEKRHLGVVFDQHQCLNSGQLKIFNDYIANQRNDYTELIDSLREDLAAAGIPSRREASASSQYRFQPAPNEPTQKEEPRVMGKPLEIDSMDMDPEDMDLMEIDEESPETELSVSNYPSYGYESRHEALPLLEGQYNPSNPPLIKVSQQIDEFEQHQTATSDASYTGDDDDDEEGFGAFEKSIIIPDPPTGHADLISPQLTMQGKYLLQNPLGFGDDELLAEQIVSTMAATTFSPEKPSPVKRTQQYRQSYQPPLDDRFDIDENTLRLSIYQPQSAHQKHYEQSSFAFSPKESLSTPLRNPSPDRGRKEDLLLSSDYNSVFKSRPKIAVSPPFTPVGGSPGTLPDLSLVSGMNRTLERVFSKDDMGDFSAQHISSPLTRKPVKKGKM